MHNENILNENELQNVSGGIEGGRFNAILERDNLVDLKAGSSIVFDTSSQITGNGWADILKKR